jgi:hypothetical protein
MIQPLLRALSNVVQAVVLCGPPNPTLSSTSDPSSSSPLASAGLLSRTYFIWANAVVLAAGRLPPIQLRALPPLLPEDTATRTRDELSALWSREVVAASHRNSPPNLRFAICRLLWRDEAAVLAFKLVGWLVASAVSSSILLRSLITFFSDGSPAWWGYVIALLYVVTEGVRSAAINQHWYIAVTAGMRLRGALRLMLAEKALRIAESSTSTGKLVNLVSADTTRCLEAMSYFQFIISTPITLVTAFGIIWGSLGPSALAGLGVMIVASLVQVL